MYTLDHLVSKLRVARRGRKAGYPIRLVLLYCDESVMAMRERRRNLDADELIERQRGVIEQVTIPLGEAADAARPPGSGPRRAASGTAMSIHGATSGSGSSSTTLCAVDGQAPAPAPRPRAWSRR